ncbi:MAG TPA: hypothetical protein PLN44_10160 [Syntrophales bacterium]|nr:hypothetical protein [Syntrophales bacterium]HRV43458.1 hypothetical protein [Syntrophales bacterium]
MVTADMEILEIIHRRPETLAVFRRLEGETGRCICCEGLFLTLAEAACAFGFDLEGTLADLRAVESNER